MSLKVTTIWHWQNTFFDVSLRRKSVWSCHGLIVCVVRDDHLCSRLQQASLHCHFCAEFSKGRAVILRHTITVVVSSSALVSKYFYPCRFRLLRSCLWMAFWVIQISVCISRVFIATHFPHQVILGLLAGEFLLAVLLFPELIICYIP